MLAVVAMLALYSIGRFGIRKSVVVAPLLLTAVLAFAPARFSEISADEESASDRIEAWYAGFQMLLDNPLFGVGKAGFVDHHVRTAHNSYVLAMAELGLVGFFFWFSLIALTVAMLFKLVRMPAPSGDDPARTAQWHEHRRLALILAYSMTAGLTAAFFLSRAYFIVLYLLIALVVGLYQSARREFAGLPSLALETTWKRLIALEIGTVIALWLTTRILLKFN